MTDEEIDTPTGRQHAFIAELTSWPGNSGSPVFLNIAGYRQGSVMLGMNLHLRSSAAATHQLHRGSA